MLNSGVGLNCSSKKLEKEKRDESMAEVVSCTVFSFVFIFWWGDANRYYHFADGTSFGRGELPSPVGSTKRTRTPVELGGATTVDNGGYLPNPVLTLMATN